MTNGRRIAVLLGWVVLAGAGACSDDGDGRDVPDVADDARGPDADADADADADEVPSEVDEPDDAGDADEGGAEVVPPCTPPSTACLDSACHAAPYGITCVGGSVADETGVPLADQAVALCAASRCLFSRSDAEGWWTVRIPATITSIESLALYFPTSAPPLPARHSPFCRFSDLCDDALHLCNDFRLYAAPTTGAEVGTGALAAEVRAEASDGAALVFPAGVEVLLPIGVEELWVALSRFPLAEHVPCFIDPANPPLALYVVTPVDSEVIEPGTMTDPVLRDAALDLPNDTGLAAGAVVDVWVLGGAHPADAGLEEGEWRALTTAAVTADGRRIRTAPGEGLGYLTWFGIYAR